MKEVSNNSTVLQYLPDNFGKKRTLSRKYDLFLIQFSLLYLGTWFMNVVNTEVPGYLP